MNIKISKSLLMSGDDYILTDHLALHHPTVGEMLCINNGYQSEDVYWTYIQTLMCDPYSHMVMLDDIGKNFMVVTPFEVFVMQWERCISEYENNKQKYDSLNIHPLDTVMSALNFFLEGDHLFTLSHYEDGSPCLYDANNVDCQVNKEVFDYIYEWLKLIHKIDYSNRINPADENARKVLIEDARDEIKKAKRRGKKKDDDGDYIGSLMSAVCFGGNGVITPHNIKDCKMYWLFEAFSLENKKSNASHILDGIYHGTIKFSDVNKKELDWAK